jgi:hypothetical protein
VNAGTRELHARQPQKRGMNIHGREALFDSALRQCGKNATPTVADWPHQNSFCSNDCVEKYLLPNCHMRLLAMAAMLQARVAG